MIKITTPAPGLTHFDLITVGIELDEQQKWHPGREDCDYGPGQRS